MKKPNELAAEENGKKRTAKQDRIEGVLSKLEKIVTVAMNSGRIAATGGTFQWPCPQEITHTDPINPTYVCEDPEIMQAIKTYFAQHGWDFTYETKKEEGWSMTAGGSTFWTEYHFTITPSKADAGRSYRTKNR